MTQGVEAVIEVPDMSSTPIVMVRELAKDTTNVRADDKRQMHVARGILHQSKGRLDGIVLHARAMQRQRQRQRKRDGDRRCGPLGCYPGPVICAGDNRGGAAGELACPRTDGDPDTGY